MLKKNLVEILNFDRNHEIVSSSLGLPNSDFSVFFQLFFNFFSTFSNISRPFLSDSVKVSF